MRSPGACGCSLAPGPAERLSGEVSRENELGPSPSHAGHARPRPRSLEYPAAHDEPPGPCPGDVGAHGGRRDVPRCCRVGEGRRGEALSPKRATARRKGMRHASKARVKARRQLRTAAASPEPVGGCGTGSVALGGGRGQGSGWDSGELFRRTAVLTASPSQAGEHEEARWDRSLVAPAPGRAEQPLLEAQGVSKGTFGAPGSHTKQRAGASRALTLREGLAGLCLPVPAQVLRRGAVGPAG